MPRLTTGVTMSEPTTSVQMPGKFSSAVEGLRRGAPYLLSLLLPGTSLAFVVADAHRLYVAAGWLGILGVFIALDGRPRSAAPAPRGAPPWLLEPLLYVLAGIQIASVAGLARLGLQSQLADALVGSVMVGVSGAFSSGVVAHELIHRPRGPGRWVGRLLLALTWYEHFFTEHLRGHHARVGTFGDPGTARFGETFWQFVLRSWPGELQSAWRIGSLQARRQGHGWAYNPVVHGLCLEMTVTTGVALLGGWHGLTLYVGHVVLATGIVMAVTYFDHWGLRRGSRLGPADAWESDAPMTHFVLLGLARHADHHLNALRPYYELELREGSPRLPHGYFRMVVGVLFRNAAVRRWLTVELTQSPRSSPPVPVPVVQVGDMRMIVR
jgi:alkane 1-monooxygenase